MTMSEKIREGFDVFTHDGEKSFGAVRQVRKHEIVIYVENGGDFVVPLDAVMDAHSEKVILDSGKLHATSQGRDPPRPFRRRSPNPIARSDASRLHREYADESRAVRFTCRSVR